MILEFKVANFRSIKEEQTLSLLAGKDETHPDNLIEANGLKLVKAAAIYGANASGKSNLIKAMQCMQSLVANSATKWNLGDPIPGIVPFRLDAESRIQPSMFELNVVIDSMRFVYGFSATTKRVHDEWLIAYPDSKSRGQTWIDRKLNPATSKTVWKFGKAIGSNAVDALKGQTRDNCLALSRGAELNVSALSGLYLWIRQNLRINDLSRQPNLLIAETARLIQDDHAFADRVNQMIRHADFGIDKISVDETELESVLSKTDASTRDKWLQFFRSTHGLRKPVLIRTTHSLPGLDRQEHFEMKKDESNGTQRFFGLAGPFLRALDKGTVLVLDEFDCSMHPLMTRKLVELFQSPEMNRKGAQLVFSTQDSTLMDPVLFRRDQIWLVEKNREGASELYSLYDFETAKRPRNDSAFEKQYLSGRFGGVPRFGATFEDLTLNTGKGE